ncbi:phenylacetate--CoA ligase family protein [Pseudomonas sp. efr-133-TYG-5]|uniref:phenylacetate--CoA ligase family protein n=1 Tax=Pseudomonas sp. efr-133-TYG-5 TaxID=3040310 RepID=UPI00255590E9|nr:phenylacetate--CoA ligase family protein [Pseudomonas sp. efr-133-TYG-5]
MRPTDTLRELVAFARQHSPYYREHFAQVAGGFTALSELPLVDPVAYWRGSQCLTQCPVLTDRFADGLVFKTGGSTGAGKLSVFTRTEWQQLVRDFARSVAGQFRPGDRVANLFFVGDLYASFIFAHDALAHVAPGVIEFPFTGTVEPADLAEAIVRQRINVLIGLPAQLLTFAAWLQSQGRTLEAVDTLLYGGESLFASQQQLLRRVLPNVRIASMGYASVDAGLLGASQRDCALGEHRMVDNHSLLEIIDEQTGEVIEQCDRGGLLVMTNLTRRLMPLIRYPVGDRACWREPAQTRARKFALLGRSADSQRVRVSILTLLIDEIGAIVRRIGDSEDWQLLIEQRGSQDLISLKWLPALAACDVARLNGHMRSALLAQYPLILQLENDRLLELHVTHCTATQLVRHPRSGKHLRVVDRRVYDDALAKQP